jgi:hypothetical protein
MAGLLLGTLARCQNSQDSGRSDSDLQRSTNQLSALDAAPGDASKDKACCMGLNDCKGQGGCAVPESHTCAGQNACKGQGGCRHHCPK